MSQGLFIPEWQDAEGDECLECGDACFLRELRMFVRVAGVKTKSNIVLCQACADLMFAPVEPMEVLE